MAASGERRRKGATTVRMFVDGAHEEKFRQEAPALLGDLFSRVPALVEKWADEIVAEHPRIVGFSSTFAQNVASLALAKAIRRRAPASEIVILIGGANCEGPMGEALAANFPFLDHVVSGEADLVIAPLLAAIAAGRPSPRVIRGIPVDKLDELPIPDFDGYFADRATLSQEWPVQLAAETSRGCWWGARSHCKFCGLNGETMTYRSKSGDRVVSEIRALRERYGVSRFMMADNILDVRYFQSVFPRLAGQGLNLFYEVKSNLRKEQLRTMLAAGVTWIQPGVESLSSRVLDLMGKGCTALQNVQMLRWCTELGIKPSWNILYGFPGETLDDYARSAQQIRDLVHIRPPSAAIPIRLDRFSPYFNRFAEEGLANLRPCTPYAFAYAGVPESERRRLAYYFEFDYADGTRPAEYVRDLLEAVEGWDTRYRNGARLAVLDSERSVYDSRDGVAELTPLTEADHAIFDLTDSATTMPVLLAGAAHRNLGAAETMQTLDAWRRRRWLFAEEERFVRLVTKMEPHEGVQA